MKTLVSPLHLCRKSILGFGANCFWVGFVFDGFVHKAVDYYYLVTDRDAWHRGSLCWSAFGVLVLLPFLYLNWRRVRAALSEV